MIDRRQCKTKKRRQKSNNAPILPVYIRTKALNKILNGKHAYQLDADLLKQIPRALTDPVAIYSSDTQPGPNKMEVALDLPKG